MSSISKKRKIGQPVSNVVSNPTAGTLVWAKFGSHRWWPGLLINTVDCGQIEPRQGHQWIYWFGDHKVSEVSRKMMVNFTQGFSELFPSVSSKVHQLAVHETLMVLADHLNHFYRSMNGLLSWANQHFPILEHIPPIENMPSLVDKHLKIIKAINEGQIRKKELSFFSDIEKLSHPARSLILKDVREGSLRIDEICISCINKDANLVATHPLFEGGLCLECKDRFVENAFCCGDDGKMFCCVICSEPGTIVVCDNPNCEKSYCIECISYLVRPDEHLKIMACSPWHCFVCPDFRGTKGLLKVKEDYEKNLIYLMKPSSDDNTDNISLIELFPVGRPINVLSLFDGISTGKVVLDSLGIKIGNYFAFEIDEDAINVSKLNHGNDITYLGCVTKINEEKIRSMGCIDLVIGGSPCQDLSLVNPNRKGLYDLSGTGHLFFDFFHVLKMVERLGDRPILFLFENVAAMKIETRETISAFLSRNPVLIDSKFCSPQCRPRYFWGNIPGLNMGYEYSFSLNWYDGGMNCPEETLLGSCLVEGLGRKPMVDRIRTVTTQRNSLVQNRLMPVQMNGVPDVVWITELEKIFGFPVHYTDTGYLSICKRQELLGRSWSVPVVKNILRPLTNFFLTANE